MNDVIHTESADSQALTVLTGAVSTILANDKNNLLGKLAEEIAAFKADVTTPAGRKAIASMAHKVASTKMDLIRLGKGLTEDWRTKTKAVNAECNVIEERMDALRNQVRAPLTAYEDREKARVHAHNEAIHAVALIDPALCYAPSHDITLEIARRMEMPARNWEEFRERAVFEHGVMLRTLRTWCKVAEEREETAAEAERQRVREAAEVARIQAEREEQIRIEAAAKARADAEAAAEAARVAEEQRVEAERAAEVERVEQQRAEAARVAQEAIEAKKRRIEEARQEAESARFAALEAEERARHAEEQRVAAEEAAEADRFQAQCDRMNAEKVAAEKAERDKQEAVEAARLAEVQRQQAEAARLKREAEQREANIAHKRKINGAAVVAIVTAMSEVHNGTADEATDIAKTIVTAIALLKVPNVTIRY